MARISIKDIMQVAVSAPHTATDYRVYRTIDSDGHLIDLLGEKLKSKDLLETSITLRNPDGSLYEAENGSIALARVWFGDRVSNWKIISACGMDMLPANLPYKLKDIGE